MREPSDKTQLRNAKNLLRRAEEENLKLRSDLQIFRAQLTKAQQDAADWRQRFDSLLARVPVTSMEAKP